MAVPSKSSSIEELEQSLTDERNSRIEDVSFLNGEKDRWISECKRLKARLDTKDDDYRRKMKLLGDEILRLKTAFVQTKDKYEALIQDKQRQCSELNSQLLQAREEYNKAVVFSEQRAQNMAKTMSSLKERVSQEAVVVRAFESASESVAQKERTIAELEARVELLLRTLQDEREVHHRAGQQSKAAMDEIRAELQRYDQLVRGQSQKIELCSAQVLRYEEEEHKRIMFTNLLLTKLAEESNGLQNRCDHLTRVADSELRQQRDAVALKLAEGQVLREQLEQALLSLTFAPSNISSRSSKEQTPKDQESNSSNNSNSDAVKLRQEIDSLRNEVSTLRSALVTKKHEEEEEEEQEEDAEEEEQQQQQQQQQQQMRSVPAESLMTPKTVARLPQTLPVEEFPSPLLLRQGQQPSKRRQILNNILQIKKPENGAASDKEKQKERPLSPDGIIGGVAAMEVHDDNDDYDSYDIDAKEEELQKKNALQDEVNKWRDISLLTLPLIELLSVFQQQQQQQGASSLPINALLLQQAAAVVQKHSSLNTSLSSSSGSASHLATPERILAAAAQVLSPHLRSNASPVPAPAPPSSSSSSVSNVPIIPSSLFSSPPPSSLSASSAFFLPVVSTPPPPPPPVAMASTIKEREKDFGLTEEERIFLEALQREADAVSEMQSSSASSSSSRLSSAFRAAKKRSGPPPQALEVPASLLNRSMDESVGEDDDGDAAKVSARAAGNGAGQEKEPDLADEVADGHGHQGDEDDDEDDELTAALLRENERLNQKQLELLAKS